jgi:hypothetical protein
MLAKLIGLSKVSLLAGLSAELSVFELRVKPAAAAAPTNPIQVAALVKPTNFFHRFAFSKTETAKISCGDNVYSYHPKFVTGRHEYLGKPAVSYE